MNNKTFLVDLVRLVFADADFSGLVSQGVRYSQISQLLEEAIEKEYVNPQEGKFVVTTKGLHLIHEGKLSERTETGWIGPMEEARIEKIELMSIYLPSKARARRLVKATSASGLRHGADESSS